MKNSRGSIWKKCDFHVHTPFSALANNFGSDFDAYVLKLFRTAIEKKIQVIGITDYFTIEGYKKIKSDYLENPAKLKELFSDDEIQKIKGILILPNIEFRLNKIVQINKTLTDGKTKTESGRINFHVIFSDELSSDLIEQSFLHDLDFVYQADPDERDKTKKLKVNNLIQLGKRLHEEQSGLKGSHLQIGMTNAVVDDGAIMDILTANKDFKDKFLIVVPSDEDLSEIQWKSQDALTRKVILSKANCFFSSNSSTIEFGLGEKSTSQEDFIKEFKSLKPCIWGSDAHGYERLFEPDNKKYCWVKANATFDGIRQILFEPKDRVYIGEEPALFSRIKASKGNYINSLSIHQLESYDGKKGTWFKDFELDIGIELIAIIGNKGKGKSAIADIVGLTGNSHVNNKDFSFLNKDKFCQRGYGENFTATLRWYDGSLNTKNLSDPVDFTSVERVKYIPQSYLEKLCNSEDSGFKEEINKVVFSRLDESDKLGKKSFPELEQFKTELITQQINILLIRLNNTNRTIDSLEGKADDNYKKSIENKKSIKNQELEAHTKERNLIVVVPNPEVNTQLSDEQRKKAELASKLSAEIASKEVSIEDQNEKYINLKIRLSELENLVAETNAYKANFDEWVSIKTAEFEKYGLKIGEAINLKTDLSKVQLLILSTNKDIEITSKLLSVTSVQNDISEEVSLVVKLDKLKKEKQKIDQELEKPFKDYQDYLLKIKEWEAKEKKIVGTELTDDTIKYYDAELTYINTALPEELTKFYDQRKSIIIDIYNQKKEIKAIYDKIKGAISDVLTEYSAEQNITIESSFKVDKFFYNQFFDYINRYGDFYSGGDEELKKFMSKYDFDIEQHLNDFIDDLEKKDLRYKENRKVDFYNYIGSLSFLHPEYDLRLNNKGLTQLSPGEKGGLLLVFYLVLDKDNKPLIIDQPEDNLDNQSVAEILVPYIKRAKKLRQIIMVTHNPNLAIVSDAEQIIYMDIDKESDYEVSYDSGGIEDATMNNHIVDILEGRMKAFDNRRVKYKK